MSDETIKVHVVDYGDRKNLVLRYVDPTTKRHVTKSAGTNNRKAAEKAAAVWESALREGRYASPSKTTWADFRERYESEVAAGLAPNTRQKIYLTFDMVEARLNPARVRDVTAQRLSSLVADLRKPTKHGGEEKPGLADTSIQGAMAHLKAALRWGERVGLLVKAPLFPKLQIPKGDTMKGRPITAEEFDRMIAAVPKVVKAEHAAEWVRYLNGLWLSGFRVTESLALSWDFGAGIVIDLSGRYPVAHIPAASQKSNRTETLPLAPEFAAMFGSGGDRSGFVFNPLQANGKRASRDMAIRTVSAIGEAAGVKVWTGKGGKVKFATAHDLRRAFGLRWSSRVMPAVLQQMMRHATIETTMKFYVGRDAQTAAGVIAEAFAKSQTGNIGGNSAVSAQSSPTPKTTKKPVKPSSRGGT